MINGSIESLDSSNLLYLKNNLGPAFRAEDCGAGPAYARLQRVGPFAGNQIIDAFVAIINGRLPHDEQVRALEREILNRR